MKFIVLIHLLFFTTLHTMNSGSNSINWNNLPREIQKDITQKSGLLSFFTHGSCIRQECLYTPHHKKYTLLEARALSNDSYNSISFVTLYKGEICKIHNGESFRINFRSGLTHLNVGDLFSYSKKVHEGEIVFLRTIANHVISIGEDGFIHLLDYNLEKRKTINFKEISGSTAHFLECYPGYILIVSHEHDYYYFTNDLTFMTKIDHKSLSKLIIKENYILLNEPTLIQELLKLSDGISFNQLLLFRAIEFAISEHRSFVIQEKEEQEIAKDFPYLLQFFKSKKYICSESGFFKTIKKVLKLVHLA